jgi:hypothetical protein
VPEKRSTFNPQAVQKNNHKKGKQNKKPKKDEKTSSFFSAQEKEQPNTRAIRFAPRTAMNIFSGLFFFLFLIMCVVVLLTFGRTDTLAQLAMSKQVNKSELIENVNEGLKETEQLKYDGEVLTEKLFTYSSKQEGTENWKASITPYLAIGLGAEQLGFSDTKLDRSCKEVKFIKLTTVDEKDRIYRLYYDVRFTEGDKWKEAQIILFASYKYGEFKLIDRPQFTNINSSESKNEIAYNEKRFLPKGTDVSDIERDKIDEFVQRFFELYVTNDEKIGLISKVKGLDNAKLKSVNPKAVIRSSDGLFHVIGTYTFSFEEENPLTSGFHLEIKQTKDSYFVNKLNEE